MMRENSPYRLLVEGSDDKYCVIHLMKRHGIDWDDPKTILPWVHACNGFEALLASVSVSAKSYQRLGIIVDANADLQHRWAQIRNGLNQSGVTLPEEPNTDGVIGRGMDPDWRLGVWLMPDNKKRGQLEDFLVRLVPADDKCWAYANEATQQAKNLGARFPEKSISKAVIHTWLAWRENPGLPFGTAITAEYFKCDSPEAMRFVQWFNRLFL